MTIQETVYRFSLCLLAWCTLAVASAFAQTITHIPLTFDSGTFFGEFSGSVSVSGAGDVNGDGFDDVIVGAPDFEANGIFSGGVRVLSGTDGSVLYAFDGDSSSDFFGESVSDAGDVNGDGFDDLIVGIPFADNGRGSARVFSGRDGSVLYNFRDSDSTDFGSSVSGAGDVNGDGFDDLIVGLPFDSPLIPNFPGGFGAGRARVFSGSDGSLLYNLDGDIAGGMFGESVSGAGDVNGDGFDDFIVGNSGFSGIVRVFSGSDGSVLYNFSEDSFDERFGSSVSGAGDVNGDGFDDLIVGNNALFGTVQVFSGSDGSVLHTFERELFSARRFGFSVSGAGDVNGDGFDDLIVGAPDVSSFSDRNGSAQVFSGDDGSVIYTFDGDIFDDEFGFSVSGAGDVNGDGVADFIVGATGAERNSGGYARLFISQIGEIVLLGDANLDGVASFLDISPFIELLASDTFLAQADCNEDGVLDFFDIAPFIEILTEQ